MDSNGRKPAVTLHLPNAHSRGSPTSQSPLGEHNSFSRVAVPSDQTALLSLWTTVTASFRSRKCKADTARDFLARERTFQTWLRLATLLAVLSGALILQLNPDQIFKSRATESLAMMSMAKRMQLTEALQHRARTNRTTSASTSLETTSRGSPSRRTLLTNPTSSLVIGIFCFALGLSCLAIGYVDYLYCIKALEKADEQDCSGQSSSTHEPEGVDAEQAGRAHTGMIVHIVEGLVAAFVAALAILLLISGPPK